MKALIFIRHAESVSNAGGITMPHADIPLSDLGCLQAQKLADGFAVEPSAVIVSGMVRTNQTSAPLCERFGVTAQTNIDLNEFSTIDPALIAGLNGVQRKPFVKDYWDNPDLHRRFGEGADTFIEFDARVSAFLAQMDNLPDGAVIFGHGIWFGLLLWRMLGYGVSDAEGMRVFRRFQIALPVPNCAVYKLHGQNGIWAAQADTNTADRIGRVRLEHDGSPQDLLTTDATHT